MTRVGLIVSKRVGKAHVRNRVKRMLRAAFRDLLPAMPAGFDVVIICRPGLAGKSFHTLDEVLRRQLLLARLLLPVQPETNPAPL